VQTSAENDKNRIVEKPKNCHITGHLFSVLQTVIEQTNVTEQETEHFNCSNEHFARSVRRIPRAQLCPAPLDLISARPEAPEFDTVST